VAKAPTAESIAANLSIFERKLLFCVASDSDWVMAGVPPATAHDVVVLGLIERDHTGGYRLTHQGRAVFSVVIGKQDAE
jgi:hypothetical protein